MTLTEALTQRLPRIRRPNWSNPEAYLRLPLLKDGKHFGPWAELYDAWGQEAIGVPIGSQTVCVLLGDDTADYEAYAGTVSPHEQDPSRMARLCAES